MTVDCEYLERTPRKRSTPEFSMQETTVNQSPANLRSLLAAILTSCIPSNPGKL